MAKRPIIEEVKDSAQGSRAPMRPPCARNEGAFYYGSKMKD